MNRKLGLMALACVLGFSVVGGMADAAWIDAVKPYQQGSGTVQSAVPSSYSQPANAASAGYSQDNGAVNKQSTRWLEVYRTDNYTIYIDKTSMEAKGEAQNRRVSGWFKRVYSPLGIQWLSTNGAGQANSITHSLYQAEYGVSSSYDHDWHYYDAKNHEIHNGGLADRHDDFATGSYIPDSFNEQIRDILFRMVGWDY